jgi:AhpD family alkylhydroperoxidase
MIQPDARVHLLTEEHAPLSVRPLFAGGDPGPIARSLAQVPELAQTALPFIGQALRGSLVDRRTAELVIVRASALLACTYCTLTHAAIALDADVDAGEVRELCDPAGGVGSFTDPRERALLRWVDEVAAGKGEIPDEVADALAAHVDDGVTVELAAMVGCTIFLNRYCTALRLPVSEASLARLVQAGIDPAELAA